MMKLGICRVCGEEKQVDCCNFCTPCYPYGDSTDVYKQALESGDFDSPKCIHNFYDGHTCTHCGATKKVVA